MQETLKSLVRLPAAITVFGIEQVQTVVGNAETQESVEKVRGVIDTIVATVSAKIDESKPTLDSMSDLGQRVVDRTFENTTSMVKTTSDWLYGIMTAAPVSSGPRER